MFFAGSRTDVRFFKRKTICSALIIPIKRRKGTDGSRAAGARKCDGRETISFPHDDKAPPGKARGTFKDRYKPI